MMALARIHTQLPLFCMLIWTTFAANLNVSGEAITTRYWDCCKPSCGWRFKADVFKPVATCAKDGNVVDVNEGTGCNGGTAFQCSSQQPWAINDTLAYGFAGAFLLPALAGGKLEEAWCCACYRLDFTSDPLRGKSMVVQASNTAYDITTTNRFTLAIPGGNVSDVTACGLQYGVDQSVFGSHLTGVSSREQCQNLPEVLRSGCQFRFDWMKGETFQSARFERVVCPREITDKSQCVRKDDETLANGTSAAVSTSVRPWLLAAPLLSIAFTFT
ncbi:RlpA-like double-psi beta-barrel-protein domain-containing protein-containing protein [Paraphoma chrysanthemicola]|nr:RlpA-like double-psi beta-barrel-protein domain-containing protein-containing protein [Paraphoma chrysanthemicola]